MSGVRHSEGSGLPFLRSYTPKYFGTPSSDEKFGETTPYPEDPAGSELNEWAQVWRAYQVEASKFDAETVAKWKSDIDLYLVFSGLFSAIVTAAIIQYHMGLFEPDYTQISVAIQAQTMNDQRVAMGLEPIPVSSSFSLDGLSEEYKVPALNLAVALLWWISLAITLSISIICILMKQWIDAYVYPILASPRTASMIRHYRYNGVQKWKLPFLFHTLPWGLNAALAMFVAGAFTYTSTTTLALTWVMTAYGVIFTGGYILTVWLPVFFPTCPYVTPATRLFYWFYQAFVRHVLPAYLRSIVTAQDPKPCGMLHREREEKLATTAEMDERMADAILWLHDAVGRTNPDVMDVIHRSLTCAEQREIHKVLIRRGQIHRTILKELETHLAENAAALGNPEFQKRMTVLLRVCRAFAQVDLETRDALEQLQAKYGRDLPDVDP